MSFSKSSAEIALAEAARETVRLPILTLLYIVSLNRVFYIEHVIIKIPVKQLMQTCSANRYVLVLF